MASGKAQESTGPDTTVPPYLHSPSRCPCGVEHEGHRTQERQREDPEIYAIPSHVLSKVQKYFLQMTSGDLGKPVAINTVREQAPVTLDPSEQVSIQREDLRIPNYVLEPLQNYFLDRAMHPEKYPRHVGIRITQADPPSYEEHPVDEDSRSGGHSHEESNNAVLEQSTGPHDPLSKAAIENLVWEGPVPSNRGSQPCFTCHQDATTVIPLNVLADLQSLFLDRAALHGNDNYSLKLKFYTVPAVPVEPFSQIIPHDVLTQVYDYCKKIQESGNRIIRMESEISEQEEGEVYGGGFSVPTGSLFPTHQNIVNVGALEEVGPSAGDILDGLH